MVVTVLTKARPLCEESFVAVCKDFRTAEGIVRQTYPNAKYEDGAFICKSNGEIVWLYFARKSTVCGS